MLKQIVLSAMFLVGVSLPVQALPGQSKDHIKSWTKNHGFLSTWLQEIRGVGNPTVLLAYRELKDQWFVDVRSYLGDDYKTIASETVFLVKKMPVAQSEHESMAIGHYDSLDKRRWEDVECKNVWQRGNATATQLLTAIYGKAVADDFNGAKLVFQGPIFQHPIYFDTAEAKVDQDIDGKPMEINSLTPLDEGHIIYLGKKFGYTNETFNRPGNMKLCGLEILPLKAASSRAGIYSHNQGVYQRLMGKKQIRDVPADISVE